MERDAAKEWTASSRTERVESGTAVDQLVGEGNVVLKERKKKRQWQRAWVMGSTWRCWDAGLVREKVGFLWRDELTRVEFLPT